MPFKIDVNTVFPVTIPDASSQVAGLMSAADKRQLTLWAPAGSGTQQINTIYVRSTGNDVTGDGSLTNPYRTVRHAMSTLTRYADQLYQIIDCTGIGVETLNSALNIPPIVSNSHVIADPNPVYAPFGVIAALTVRAIPTVIDTLAANSYTVISATTTFLATVQCPGKTWTPGEHIGRQLRWNATGLSTIVNNGTDTLEVAVDGTFLDISQTAEIVEPSAELRLGAVEGGSLESTLQCSGTLASVALEGIKVTRTNPAVGSNQALVFSQLEDFLAYGCWLQGVDLNAAAATTPLFAGCYMFRNMPADSFNVVGSGFGAYDCVWKNLDFQWTVQGGAAPGVYVQTSIFDACGSVGHNENSQPILAYKFTQCNVRNGIGPGFVYGGGATCVIQQCAITNCNGSAIAATAPGLLYVTDTTGSGNTEYGVKAINGAHVIVSAGTSVAGTAGDLKVGELAVRSWTDFRTNAPLRNQADFFVPATSDGSIVTQR
jgi:hypothetical protein